MTVAERSLEQVHAEMARALGVSFEKDADEHSRADTLRAALNTAPRIVFLDDVRDGFRSSLRFCLPPAPPCACLVTSRLHDLPGLVGGVRELDFMDERQSLALLNSIPEVAQALAREPEAARELVRACACHPLALSLAASGLKARLTLSPTPVQAFVTRLCNRLDILKREGSQNKLDSLRANFELSYAGLSSEDQRRYPRLAVFAPTGFGLSAAAALWEDSKEEAEKAVVRLLDASLLLPVIDHAGRWRLHALLADYADERLQANGEKDETQRALADWILSLFGEHEMDDLSNAPELALELDNLVLSARRAASAGDGEILARLATVPRNWLLNIFRINEEWEVWLKKALNLQIRDQFLKAGVYGALGGVQQFRADYDGALESYTAALALYQQVGDRLGEANTRRAIGGVQQFRDDYDGALESYTAALALFQQVGDRLGEANAIIGIGQLALLKGEQDRANEFLIQAVQMYTDIGDRYSVAAVTANYGWTLKNHGQSGAAQPYFARAAGLFAAAGMLDRAEKYRALSKDLA